MSKQDMDTHPLFVYTDKRKTSMAGPNFQATAITSNENSLDGYT